jgi:hypothetical protein
MTVGTTTVPVGSRRVFLHRVLSVAEAAEMTNRVLHPTGALRAACWHPQSDLVTIGAPLYCNRDEPTAYAGHARATNAMLYDAYRQLYDRVADFFEDRYGTPVSFVDELAVPGFHLMHYAAPGRYEGGGWHMDQIATQVPYFVEHATELRGSLNFTLPLAVPSGGTGMDLRGDVGDLFHVPYEPGVMLFNECEITHRIGGSRCAAADEIRLTLQGHGVRFRGRTLLFW